MRSIAVEFNQYGYYRTEETLTDAMHLSDGMPLRWGDLAPLRRSESSFTVSIQAWPPRVVPNVTGNVDAATTDWRMYASSTKYTHCQKPGNWPGVGIDLVSQGHRDFGLDILVA